MTKWQKYALIAGAAALAVWWIRRKAGQVVDAVNPVNDKNVFYQGASEVARELTGDEDGTLGTILYDVLHPEEGQ